jgi:predicted GNAT family acetyltransferase
MTDQSQQAGAGDLSQMERVGAGPTRTKVIEHLADHGRFRLLIDGREVAVLDYRRLAGKWNIVHTYTDPASRGYGVASDLVRSVLETAREEGVKVIPTCPYVEWWIDEHRPDYEDLVAGA